jgi:hypothetical protein
MSSLLCNKCHVTPRIGHTQWCLKCSMVMCLAPGCPGRERYKDTSSRESSTNSCVRCIECHDPKSSGYYCCSSCRIRKQHESIQVPKLLPIEDYEYEDSEYDIPCGQPEYEYEYEGEYEGEVTEDDEYDPTSTTYEYKLMKQKYLLEDTQRDPTGTTAENKLIQQQYLLEDAQRVLTGPMSPPYVPTVGEQAKYQWNMYNNKEIIDLTNEDTEVIDITEEDDDVIMIECFSC